MTYTWTSVKSLRILYSILLDITKTSPPLGSETLGASLRHLRSLYVCPLIHTMNQCLCYIVLSILGTKCTRYHIRLLHTKFTRYQVYFIPSSTTLYYFALLSITLLYLVLSCTLKPIKCYYVVINVIYMVLFNIIRYCAV